jgi:hypothetical protein
LKGPEIFAKTRKFQDYNIAMPPTPHARPLPDDALPPEEVRFSELRVEPWPDGRRIRVHLTLTPFQQNPNLDMTLSDETGAEAGRVDIIETIENRIVFTMHIRSALASGPFSLKANISYPEIGVVASQTISFNIPPASGGDH